MAAFENNSGKISAKTFKEDLLNKCGALRDEVIVGPAFGVDTSIVDIGDGKALAVSSDPLSLIPSLGMKVSAWLSVHLLVNDMVTTGVAPQYAQFVLNLPTSLSREDFNSFWGHINTICKETGIHITGGHTGQIPGQESTICGGGTMFLNAAKKDLLVSKNVQPGDSIIITKHAGLSSTALLSRAFPEKVAKECGSEIQEKAADNFWNISVLKEALITSKILEPNADLHAMHDVTEGGVLGAIAEMAEASGCGFEVEKDKIPVTKEVREIANLFDIDPLISIGAGSMVIAVENGVEEKLIQSLSEEGIEATKVGKFTANDLKEIKLSNGKFESFVFDGEDPYWMAFFKALELGWK